MVRTELVRQGRNGDSMTTYDMAMSVLVERPDPRYFLPNKFYCQVLLGKATVFSCGVEDSHGPGAESEAADEAIHLFATALSIAISESHPE